VSSFNPDKLGHLSTGQRKL